MKPIKIITIAFMIFALFVSNQPIKATNNPDEAVQFHAGSLKEAMMLAKKENKIIFLDISASWCGYCKKMKANIYTNDEVAAFYNKQFINVMVDGEKGEGVELAKKYGVMGYPTFVFINPDGSMKEKTSGYRDAAAFINLGQSMQNR